MQCGLIDLGTTDDNGFLDCEGQQIATGATEGWFGCNVLGHMQPRWCMILERDLAVRESTGLSQSSGELDNMLHMLSLGWLSPLCNSWLPLWGISLASRFMQGTTSPVQATLSRTVRGLEPLNRSCMLSVDVQIVVAILSCC